MKILGETKGIELLHDIREEFREEVDPYQMRAKDCGTCDTPGACCLDAHFVNVRITRLEAVAIGRVIDELPVDLRDGVWQRVDNAVDKYDLSEASQEKFACPLFEKGIGCLVHQTAKPLPCIAHACYEKREDLPPDQLLEMTEGRVDRLNRRVYGKASVLLPLPLAVRSNLARE